MENYLYFLLLVFLGLAISLVVKVLQKPKHKLPPSPVSLPMVGHLHILKKPLHLTLQTLASQHGPVLYLRFGSRSAVVVSSASAAEECFTRNDIALANRPRTLAGDHLSYGYLALGFAPYGDLWRILRRLTVVEIFSSNGVQKFSGLREEEVASLCRRLFDLSRMGEAKVDLKYCFSLLTANILMRMVVSRRVSEETGADAVVETEKRLLADFKERFYPTMSMNLCDFIPVLRWFGYKGVEKSMVRMREMRDRYLQNLIDEVRLQRSNRSSKDKASTHTVIETLLSFQESDPEFYSDTVIKSIILMMFTAGADTSAITLEWAMSLLLSNPGTLHKLRAEIERHVGDTHLITDTDLANLPYLRCIINETLRLYPATPLLLPHSSSETCDLGGYKIPGGAMVLVNAWAMHRDPIVWEDPESFKPERFEGVSGERDGFRYIPFGAGRRACPGATMGMRVVSLALAMLVQCFEWEKVEEQIDMSQTVGLTLSKAKPLEARCRPRHNIDQLFFNSE